MDVLKRHSDILEANKLRPKPPIPSLPANLEILMKLFRQQFKVVRESAPVSEWGGEWRPAEVAVTYLEMKCPFCEMEFQAIRRSGCFAETTFPPNCPNCGFPDNVLDELIKKRKEKENKRG